MKYKIETRTDIHLVLTSEMEFGCSLKVAKSCSLGKLSLIGKGRLEYERGDRR